MTCGIYALRFSNTDKLYIGQSLNIEERYAAHLRLLKCGNSSKKLLEAHRVYGEPILDILTICSKEELNTFENETIEIFNSVFEGFNSNEKADTCPILRGEEHGRSKYTNEQVVNTFNLLVNRFDLSYIDISNIVGIPPNRVSAICNGFSHCWLEKQFPDTYKLMKNRPSRCSAKDRGIVYPPILSPEGVSYNVENTTTFAKEFGLIQSNLSAVLRGKRKTHKGWRLATGVIL